MNEYLKQLDILKWFRSNLANNNFSGTIPATLLQKQGLDFRYVNSFKYPLVIIAMCW